ncbi:MAG: hypothetical protein H6741_18950 [Alphaproteobacteria bacterium]|nr:hypothetical protein [Alphaproteobacteria bacterium]
MFLIQSRTTMSLTARSSAASRTASTPHIQGLDRAELLFQEHGAPEADHITATLITADKRESTVDRTVPGDPAPLLGWARALAEEHLAPGDGQRLRLRVWAPGGRKTLGSVSLNMDAQGPPVVEAPTLADAGPGPIPTTRPDAPLPAKPRLFLGSPPGMCPAPPTRDFADAPQRAELEEELEALRSALHHAKQESDDALDEARAALEAERQRTRGLTQELRRAETQAQRALARIDHHPH